MNKASNEFERILVIIGRSGNAQKTGMRSDSKQSIDTEYIA